MKALSVKQPWAALIVCGEKRVETRTWTPPKGLTLPFRVAVHASAGLEVLGGAFWPAQMSMRRRGYRVGSPGFLSFSAIVGTVEVAKVAPIEPGLVARLTERERAFGHYDEPGFAWALRKPTRLRHPIPMPGQLKLWDVPAEVAEALERGIGGETGQGELVCALCGGALDGAHMVEECSMEAGKEEGARHAEEAVLREAFEERAGILEFDGGLSRGTAEQEAARMVLEPVDEREHGEAGA